MTIIARFLVLLAVLASAGNARAVSPIAPLDVFSRWYKMAPSADDLAGEGLHYEPRWFKAWPNNAIAEIEEFVGRDLLKGGKSAAAKKGSTAAKKSRK